MKGDRLQEGKRVESEKKRRGGVVGWCRRAEKRGGEKVRRVKEQETQREGNTRESRGDERGWE